MRRTDAAVFFLVNATYISLIRELVDEHATALALRICCLVVYLRLAPSGAQE
jgi:hypothetical protein